MPITDILMPDSDGLEVMLQFLEAARQAGAEVTLRKPFDPDELLQLLAALPR